MNMAIVIGYFLMNISYRLVMTVILMNRWSFNSLVQMMWKRMMLYLITVGSTYQPNRSVVVCICYIYSHIKYTHIVSVHHSRAQKWLFLFQSQYNEYFVSDNTCKFFSNPIWGIYSLQVAYHTPPRFPLGVIEIIRKGASLLFQRLGLQDFARIDGWFLPDSGCKLSSSESEYGRTGSGTVIFTDINMVRWFSLLGDLHIVV